MNTESGFNLPSTSVMTQLTGMHMMAAHLHREAIETFGKNHETIKSEISHLEKRLLYMMYIYHNLVCCRSHSIRI